MFSRMAGKSALYWSDSFSVMTRLRAADMASGDGVCAGATPIESRNTLPTIIRRLIGRKDIGLLLRRMIALSSRIEISEQAGSHLPVIEDRNLCVAAPPWLN